MAQNHIEPLPVQDRGSVLSSSVDEPYAVTNIGRLSRAPLLGLGKHRGRRVQEGDVIAGTRERKRLVTGSTAYVENPCGRLRKMIQKVTVQDERPDPTLHRRVSPVNKLLRQSGPRVSVHTHHTHKPEGAKPYAKPRAPVPVRPMVTTNDTPHNDHP
ncbi:hypothetical protein GCM10022254_00170 [Actinomadura meridiana]|uniref:Uncharacterized protein n=1 Tax=Actinomadura meridiana TaxID=559626 RepID=A0ABP8BRA6_9ACTN